ncbi:hypothetical protein OEZ85_000678 [Tetradesmus obliquus]|uniref:Uncharacterized protein n=1 Tax=Tetradesmus obliquus TaxID=3088 RepID=A0ABY8UM63_TETOB|nr:hypothetical protein OEZ85_000678 [Tetradesmus obliquus]
MRAWVIALAALLLAGTCSRTPATAHAVNLDAWSVAAETTPAAAQPADTLDINAAWPTEAVATVPEPRSIQIAWPSRGSQPPDAAQIDSPRECKKLGMQWHDAFCSPCAFDFYYDNAAARCMPRPVAALTAAAGKKGKAVHVPQPPPPPPPLNCSCTVPGPTGPPGPQGTAGPAGKRGVDGPDGVNGTNGKDGKDGMPGPTGPTGPRGLPGPNGHDGPDGLMGPTGPTGAPGADTFGTTGPQGRPGPAGLPGPDGQPGAAVPGPAGPPGPGITGPQGPQGGRGPDGADGARGPNGKFCNNIRVIDIYTSAAPLDTLGPTDALGYANDDAFDCRLPLLTKLPGPAATLGGECWLECTCPGAPGSCSGDPYRSIYIPALSSMAPATPYIGGDSAFQCRWHVVQQLVGYQCTVNARLTCCVDP